MPKERKKKKKEGRYSYENFPHLLAMKPAEKYVFHSDYFTIDDGYATILSFFHMEGATDNFGVFWGINRIPSGLDQDVSTYCFEGIRRMDEQWLSQHQSRSEQVAQMNSKEQGAVGSNTTKMNASRKEYDLEVIARELQDGASYLKCQYRLMVKAPTLEKLDKAIEKIARLYIDRFATLSAAPYIGEQKRELNSLFSKVEQHLGHGFYFTSTEYAGSYSIVTHGLEDPSGEYVGYMIGDVNNSAVLFDVNRYKHHVVIANENYDEELDRAHVSDVWGSKISQSCLLDDHKVVHMVLDGADMDKLGPKFENFTYRIDLNHGDVNMFEMFGDIDDELSVFPSQMQKLVLMAEQAYETTDSDRSIIRGSLEEIATKFYIDNRMWYDDAIRNRKKLRVVGIPHAQVPKLQMFVSYLDTEYKAMVNQSARDDERLHALSVLRVTFKNMLTNNGDLFNTITKDSIDGAKTGRRVLYDFSKLMQRGKGIAMAQFVNIIGFAAGNLGDGDSIIIHGAEILDDSVKEYVNTQFERLWDKGGRVVYLYNNIDKMLADKDFSHFDKANYTILGNMSETNVADYQKLLGQEIPPDLVNLVTTKNDAICYIRRDFDNVVFQQNLQLGIKAHRKEMNRL